MISAHRITKQFASLRALSDVSFQVEQGECVALMGANGAGKTTLIRILSTLARATNGSAEIAGYDVGKSSDKIRQNIGVVSHHTFLYGDLSAEENLLFYGRMYDVPNLSRRVSELLSQVELKQRRYDDVRTFSRGMQQRLSLARAILHQPTVLLFDEPFTGLDVHATDLLTRFIDQFIKDKITVLFTIHDLDYALHHAQRLFLLKNGQLMVDAPVTKVNRENILELINEQ